MAYNAGERKDVRKAEKAERQAQLSRGAVIRDIMGQPGGREWIHDILTGCHLFSTTFSLDSHQAAFAEGERNVGLKLLNDVMRECPDNYMQMMREANGRDSRSRTSDSSPSDDTDSSPDPDSDDSGDSGNGAEPIVVKREGG